jgi:hypothetical protein
MVQECEAVIRIFNTEKPSTIRDYLKAYFKKAEHRTILGEKVKDIDVWRDDDDVLVKIDVDVNCDYMPGCKGSYWEPGEPASIEGCLDIFDFINFIDEIMSKNFPDEEYEVYGDDDSSIPTEEDLLDMITERDYYYYDEF